MSLPLLSNIAPFSVLQFQPHKKLPSAGVYSPRTSRRARRRAARDSLLLPRSQGGGRRGRAGAGLTGASGPQVLELYGNRIASMECLCARPPPRLQHLGLGHNKLLGPLQSLYVTSEHW